MAPMRIRCDKKRSLLGTEPIYDLDLWSYRNHFDDSLHMYWVCYCNRLDGILYNLKRSVYVRL